MTDLADSANPAASPDAVPAEAIERLDALEPAEEADEAEPAPPAATGAPATEEQPLDTLTRRSWLGRGAILTVIAVNAVLALRDSNSAFQDEADYIYAGHLELDHLLHGVPETAGFNNHFSGVPAVYPVLAALIDSVGGLTLVRLFSLAAIAGTILLLYSATRRLFDVRIACCAIALYGVTEPTIFLANFATFDAPVLFLLSLAIWIVVVTAPRRGFHYLWAAPVLGVAIAFKYFAAVWVGPIALMAALVALPHRGRRAFWRFAALPALTYGLVAGAFLAGGHGFVHDALYNASSRVNGHQRVMHLVWPTLQWIGMLFGAALLGAVLYVLDPRTERTAEAPDPCPSRLNRAALGVVLVGSALIPLAIALKIGSNESLNRHVGYGMLLAAPMAGFGLAKIIGGHFSRLQIGIAIWLVTLVLGVQQARDQYDSWPTTTPLNTVLAAYYHPSDKVFVDVDEAEVYYLHAWDDTDKWTTIYWFSYTTKHGQHLVNGPAYAQAIKDGYFDIIAYDASYRYSTAFDSTVRHLTFPQMIAASGRYRLVAVLPMNNNYAPYYVWLRVRNSD